MTDEELVDLNGNVGQVADGTADMEWEGIPDEVDPDDSPYSRSEWWAVLIPALMLLAIVSLIVFTWYMLLDTGPDHQPLQDVDEEDTFNLLGHWRRDLTVYGTHVASVNLTLDKGDSLTMTFASHGPPEGIQVRLQHPLHPTDGMNGTGGTMVYATSVGGNGTIVLSIEEPGAYQLYFWHPGATKAPGPGDDPDDHTMAAVTYRLVVIRAHRP